MIFIRKLLQSKSTVMHQLNFNLLGPSLDKLFIVFVLQQEKKKQKPNYHLKSA
jgi:hypothetical protein